MQSEYSNLLLKIMPMTKSDGEACPPPGRPPRHVKRRLIKSISDAFASHIHFEEESLTVPSSVAKCTPSLKSVKWYLRLCMRTEKMINYK